MYLSGFPGPPLLLCAYNRSSILYENSLDVHTRSLACPHLVSFFYPVPIFEQDIPYCLRSAPALALLGIGLVDGVEVCAEGDLAGAHLCDYGADRSVFSGMDLKGCSSRLYPQSKEISPVLGLRPGLCLFDFHYPADGRFGGCH
ncbi:uncharacterized protein BDZ99DRAFT_481251 [Mytilinidion resinicola]|uniref:Uncharacterized protein n=1 Tax=Mytilinidion resinicola TaxID=574789 RepID=A0A6A6Y6K5_9PEZI|nr:uncharacterized protein BDZ99DRAFT_481251 [Mytilinidion resinicola]KAF2804432.1 hypothetical protein BDZ99DRAFT_481251 [Mytilinidion resinicola]